MHTFMHACMYVCSIHLRHTFDRMPAHQHQHVHRSQAYTHTRARTHTHTHTHTHTYHTECQLTSTSMRVAASAISSQQRRVVEAAAVEFPSVMGRGWGERGGILVLVTLHGLNGDGTCDD